MNDNVYIFDKITKKRTLLGEIQANFNMSQVIDGSKDSTTILVWSFIDFKIEPYTILWHKNTNTWWVVSHDKVERYENENGALWVHNLDLLGAIELCNARDLIDCGFNDKTYTRGEFINRLIGLSTFEYEFELDTELALQPKVDFLKTFENYTLLVALREFLDAFNCCAKLSFTTQKIGGETYIYKAVFNILLKTGNKNLASHDFSDFTETKEIKTMDKSSFGTCVVSNADNVVSTQAKTYPATGVVGFSSNEYYIKYSNAQIRLPAPVYKVNWLKMVIPSFYLTLKATGLNPSPKSMVIYDNDDISIYNLKNTAQDLYDNGYIDLQDLEYINEHASEMIKTAKDSVTVTLYGGCSYNPDDTFSKPDNVPYIPYFTPELSSGGHDLQVILCPKETKQNMRLTQQGIAWERGSNLITGFEILDENGKVKHQYTDGAYAPIGEQGGSYADDVVLYESHDLAILLENGAVVLFGSMISGTFAPAKFIVNYIPMTNLKLKVDNNRDKKDIKLYNQNGKFTDSYALSKLLNSHSKEIGSDSITKYAHYYDFASVPKVGSMVFKDNETYVINNVSMDFSINESGYYIACEFTMSKYISTKSIMVNPNTNIRDYGIPQQYNVKRKQLYRDYYELSYETYEDANQETPYLVLNKVLKLGNEYEKTNDYGALIRVEFDHQVDGATSWFYQLECSTIMLQKQMVMICDFIDNNIIGYCQNNRTMIFDVSNLFNQHSLINTPISYVDENGKAKGLYLTIINQNNKTAIDYEYYESQHITPSYDALATQVFIPQELYAFATISGNYEFLINEPNYNKDALEVPVFEYCCQIDDSDDILVGDNVLQQYENSVYFYDFITGNHLTQNDNWDNYSVTHGSEEIEPGVWVEYWEMDRNAIKIEYNGSYELRIKRYESARYYPGENRWVYGNQLTIPTGTDIAIYRHSVIGSQETDLLFICKNVSSEHIIDNGKTLVLKVNHYKLK